MSALTPGTTALITGASAGLGDEFARRLSRRGLDLVLVARREDRLQEVAERIRRETGRQVTVIVQDLSAPDAGRSLHEQVRARGLEVAVLVNNAGFGMRGPLIDADPDRIDEMVRLNVGTLTSLTRLFAADMVGRGGGTIVNIASMAALAPTPRMAAYSATKAYVLNLTEALAEELRGTGVHAVAVSPGPTRTEFFDVAGGWAGSRRIQLTADRVVAATLSALDRHNPPLNVVPGIRQRVLAGLARLLPRRVLVSATGRMMR